MVYPVSKGKTSLHGCVDVVEEQDIEKHVLYAVHSSSSRDAIEVLGCVDVIAVYNGHSACVSLLVVRGDRLFWVRIGHTSLNYTGNQFNLFNHLVPLQALLQKYQSIFKESLVTLKGFKAHIHVDPNV